MFEKPLSSAGDLHYTQVILLIGLGLLWIIPGLFHNDFVKVIIGLIWIICALSFILTGYVVKNSRAKRYAEVALFATSLGLIILGYILTREIIFIIFIALVIAMLSLAFILSYLLPKIREK